MLDPERRRSLEEVDGSLLDLTFVEETPLTAALDPKGRELEEVRHLFTLDPDTHHLTLLLVITRMFLLMLI